MTITESALQLMASLPVDDETAARPLSFREFIASSRASETFYSVACEIYRLTARGQWDVTPADLSMLLYSLTENPRLIADVREYMEAILAAYGIAGALAASWRYILSFEEGSALVLRRSA